jgi:hypothetical protein
MAFAVVLDFNESVGVGDSSWVSPGRSLRRASRVELERRVTNSRPSASRDWRLILLLMPQSKTKTASWI